MKRSTRCVAASLLSKVTAGGAYDSHFYPIPVGTR